MKLSRNAWHYKLWAKYKRPASYIDEDGTSFKERNLSLCSYFWTVVLCILNLIIFKPLLWCFGCVEYSKHSMDYTGEEPPIVFLKLAIWLNIWLWWSKLGGFEEMMLAGTILAIFYIIILVIVAALVYIKIPSLSEKSKDTIENTLDLIGAFASAKKNKVCPKLEVVD